jgi:phage shock protein A
MTIRRRGLVARFNGLLRGLFASWLREREEQRPRAVYEHAIQQRVDQYAELKRAVAGILYMRNKLEAEIGERGSELARTLEDVRRAVRRHEDDLALTLVEKKQALVEELEHAERELGGVRDEADEAKSNLVRFREEIRSLEREKTRVMATLANAEARRQVQESLAGLSVDADVRALDGVREHVENEAGLERELGARSELGARMQAIRSEARHEAARRELAELKRARQPVALPNPASQAAPAPPAAALRSSSDAGALGNPG